MPVIVLFSILFTPLIFAAEFFGELNTTVSPPTFHQSKQSQLGRVHKVKFKKESDAKILKKKVIYLNIKGEFENGYLVISSYKPAVLMPLHRTRKK